MLGEAGKQDSNGWAALHWACFLGHASCAKLLLQESDVASLSGEAPPFVAQQNGKSDCAQLVQDFLKQKATQPAKAQPVSPPQKPQA